MDTKPKLRWFFYGQIRDPDSLDGRANSWSATVLCVFPQPIGHVVGGVNPFMTVRANSLVFE